MKTSPHTASILWAIDPFENFQKSTPHLIETLKALGSQGSIRIEPVHVLTFTSEDRDQPLNQMVTLKKAAEKSIQAAIKDIENISFSPPRILTSSGTSMSKMVETLVKYASQARAKLIVTGTHAKQGLPRLFLGSFAESLLLISPIPVVILGPECKTPKKSKNRMLFATDFSESSEAVFKKAIAFAQSQDLEMILFHVLGSGMTPLLQSSAFLLSGAIAPIPNTSLEGEEEKSKLAQKWTDLANSMNLKVSVHLESSPGNTTQLILNYAQTQNLAWIALAAESGRLASAIIGSIAREVIRQAPCPVWVARA